jgi:heptosyltransferase II
VDEAADILIVQTAFLGDLLLGIAFFKRLRHLYPSAKIHLVCRQGLGDLMHELGMADLTYEIKKGDGGSYQEIKNRLKKISFQKIFSPHESLRTALLIKSLKAKKKIGYFHLWNFPFFDLRIKKPFGLPEALRQLSLLAEEDASVKDLLVDYQQKYPAGDLGPVPSLASIELEKVQSLTAPQISGRVICLFPGSVWATKQWRLEGFTDLAKRLTLSGYQVVLLGGKGEESLGKAILQEVPSAVDLIAKTSLQETLKIIQAALLVITNDSAGQHLATVAGAPVVSIFGPTVLQFGFRPWSEKARVVEKVLACRPCGPHGHQQCPLGTHECMKMISSRDVLQAAVELIPDLKVL